MLFLAETAMPTLALGTDSAKEKTTKHNLDNSQE